MPSAEWMTTTLAARARSGFAAGGDPDRRRRPACSRRRPASSPIRRRGLAGARAVLRPAVAGLVPAERPDALDEAPARVAADAAAFGAQADRPLTPEQCDQLRALAGARRDAALAALVERLAHPGVPVPPALASGAEPALAAAR
jgi:hypothetical protein